MPAYPDLPSNGSPISPSQPLSQSQYPDQSPTRRKNHGRMRFPGVLGMLLIGTLIGGTGCQLSNIPLPFRHAGQIRAIDTVQTQVEVGSTVYVRGQVGDRIPLVDGQVYELEDNTGRIWVVTSDPSLSTGDELVIQGTLSYQATPEFGADSGERYLWETMQIERSP